MEVQGRQQQAHQHPRHHHSAPAAAPAVVAEQPKAPSMITATQLRAAGFERIGETEYYRKEGLTLQRHQDGTVKIFVSNPSTAGKGETITGINIGKHDERSREYDVIITRTEDGAGEVSFARRTVN